ncbi:hypothetical protein [Gordonia malaquae]|uniref:hypothetical protein n=1 Tax=Gordonia malaquae TaxID=410332 RepID=UPI00301A1438
MNRTKKFAVAAAACAALIGGAGAVVDSPADAAIYPVGKVQGHAAFAIGPYAKKEVCQKRADILKSAGAKRFGSMFGECYFRNGAWWARSPWAA